MLTGKCWQSKLHAITISSHSHTFLGRCSQEAARPKWTATQLAAVEEKLEKVWALWCWLCFSNLNCFGWLDVVPLSKTWRTHRRPEFDGGYVSSIHEYAVVPPDGGLRLASETSWNSSRPFKAKIQCLPWAANLAVWCCDSPKQTTKLCKVGIRILRKHPKVAVINWAFCFEQLKWRNDVDAVARHSGAGTQQSAEGYTVVWWM